MISDVNFNIVSLEKFPRSARVAARYVPTFLIFPSYPRIISVLLHLLFRMFVCCFQILK